ncbi:MAG: hypothetical protein ACLRVU_00995 [Beduini sp.]|uniref:hypothetical protein n=1 Tax=Beduini sp. TaxID=1922300 RepID=UPI0039A1B4C8
MKIIDKSYYYETPHINSIAVTHINSVCKKMNINCYVNTSKLKSCMSVRKCCLSFIDENNFYFIAENKEYFIIPLCRINKSFTEESQDKHTYLIIDCSLDQEQLICLDCGISPIGIYALEVSLNKIVQTVLADNKKITYYNINLMDEGMIKMIHKNNENIIQTVRIKNKDWFDIDVNMRKHNNQSTLSIITDTNTIVEDTNESNKTEENELLKIAIEAYLENNKLAVATIKAIREKTGLGLVQAKAVYDKLISNYDQIYSDLYSNQQTFETVNSTIDLESMSLEELKKMKEDLEKKKLIEELKQLQSPKPKQTYRQPPIQTRTPTHTTYVEKPMTKRQVIKENKKNRVACCPKCGSTTLTTTNKKLSIKRGVVGLAINPLAGAIGAVTSKQVYCVCMNCGHRWKL